MTLSITLEDEFMDARIILYYTIYHDYDVLTMTGGHMNEKNMNRRPLKSDSIITSIYAWIVFHIRDIKPEIPESSF